MKQNPKAQLGCNTQSQSVELGLSSLKMQQPFLLPVTCISTMHTVSLTRKPGLTPGLTVFTDENPKFVLESCESSAHYRSLLTDLV